MIGVRRQARQFEGSDDAFVAVAELPCRTDQPLLDHRSDDAESFQHVERRRMKRGGAQVARKIRACLDERHRNPFVDQKVRSDEADRPGADDDDVVLILSSTWSSLTRATRR